MSHARDLEPVSQQHPHPVGALTSQYAVHGGVAAEYRHKFTVSERVKGTIVIQNSRFISGEKPERNTRSSASTLCAQAERLHNVNVFARFQCLSKELRHAAFQYFQGAQATQPEAGGPDVASPILLYMPLKAKFGGTTGRFRVPLAAPHWRK